MNIGIIGAGTMGQGIAQAFAEKAGNKVLLCDLTKETADAGKQKIADAFEELVEKGRVDKEHADLVCSQIGTGTPEDTKFCDLIVEAVIENIKAKKELFGKLDKICQPDTIFASNTSSLSVAEISNGCGRPVMGMHFFNPVPRMKLVEVIRAFDTPDEMVVKVKQIAESIGKVPVEVSEQPGFVVNRILIPMINEAVGLYALGAASVEDIDTAMQLGANHPIGPLALGDLVGLDVCLAIMEVIHAETGDTKYRPDPLLRKMVRGGRLGRKSGHGFYKY